MCFDFNPSLWFVCKLCREAFSDTDKLKAHKLESHLGESLNIKCIVFEESLLSDEWIPRDVIESSSNKTQTSNSTSTNKFFTAPTKTSSPKNNQIRKKTLFRNPYVSLKSLTKQELKSVSNSSNSRRPSNFNPEFRPQPKKSCGVSKKRTFPNVSVHKKQKEPNFEEITIKSENPWIITSSTSLSKSNCTLNFNNVNLSHEHEVEAPANYYSDLNVAHYEQPLEFHNENPNHVEVHPQNVLNYFQQKDFDANFSSRANNDSNNGGFSNIKVEFIDYDSLATENSKLLHQIPEREIFTTETSSDSIDIDPLSEAQFPISPDVFVSDLISVPARARAPASATSTQRNYSSNTSHVFKPFVCKTCYASFRSNYSLGQHMISHSDRRPFNCPHCPSAFKTLTCLNQHLIVHGRETRHQCRFCGKFCASNRDLMGHESSHTGERSFRCEVVTCGMTFLNKSTLFVHTRTAHCEELGLQQFVCPTCGEAFGLKSFLKRHSRKHLSIAPVHQKRPKQSKSNKVIRFT